MYGLPEKTSMRILRHEFERKKERENLAEVQRLESRAQGQRHVAKQQYEDELKKRSETFQAEQDNLSERRGYVLNPAQQSHLNCNFIPDAGHATEPRCARRRVSEARNKTTEPDVWKPPQITGPTNEQLLVKAQWESVKSKQEAHEKVQNDLLKEYPHGIPKSVLARVAAQGENPHSLPTLGYGCPSSVSHKVARAALRD